MTEFEEHCKGAEYGYPGLSLNREKEPSIVLNRRMRRRAKHFVRLFVNVIRDDELQALDPEIFRAFILFLCAAVRGNGVLPSVPILERWLREKAPVVEYCIAALLDVGFLQRVKGSENQYKIRHWSTYQPARGKPSPSLGWWLRLDLDIRYSRKIMLLPVATFKWWINVLCLAKMDCTGILPSLQAIAWELNTDLAEAQQQFDALIGAGLIDVDMTTGRYSPHDWHRWQCKPSAERMRKCRDRRKAKEPAKQAAPHFRQKVTPDVTGLASPSLLLSKATKRSESCDSKILPGEDVSLESARESTACDGGGRGDPPGDQNSIPGWPTGTMPATWTDSQSRQGLPARPHASRPRLRQSGQSGLRESEPTRKPEIAVSDSLSAFLPDGGKGARS